MKPPLTLAVLQHEPTPADHDAALARTLEALASARINHHADVLLIPEVSLTGYLLEPHELQACAEPANGPTATTLAAACKQHGIALAYGFIELHDGACFNAVQLIDATGTRRGVYRKTHLWPAADSSRFTAGEEHIPVIDILGWQIGLLICYDIEFPENIRILALAGAELVLIPTALMEPFEFVATHVLPVRAFENTVYVAYANYCGDERGLSYVGHSGVHGPNGKTLAAAGTTPTLLTATLAPDAIEEAARDQPYLRDRRPELYGELTRKA